MSRPMEREFSREVLGPPPHPLGADWAVRRMTLGEIVDYEAGREARWLEAAEELAGAPDQTTRAIRRGQLDLDEERAARQRWNPRDG